MVLVVLIEDSCHLFIKCDLSFWRLFYDWWKVIWKNHSDISNMFMFFFSVPFENNVKNIWLISVGAAIWSVSLTRCEKVYNEKQASVKDLLFFTKLRSLFWIKAVSSFDRISEVQFERGSAGKF
ncbi:hypothetical protein GQ457_10G027790 [Hibiscus cannabinus]